MYEKLRSLICLIKGHKIKDFDEAAIRIYIERDKQFVYHGRLFKCLRCNALVHIRGIRACEINDLLLTTLKSFPPGCLEYSRHIEKEKNVQK
jgi:hypothetical protein